jgi:hypothetical protein
VQPQDAQANALLPPTIATSVNDAISAVRIC